MSLAEVIRLLLLVTPAEAVDMALADARTLPPQVAYTTRYLWRGNRTDKEWESLTKVLAGHLNGTSRDANIWQPVPVGSHLLRVNLQQYGQDPKVWDKLEDPVFTTPVTKDCYEESTEYKPWPGGVWPDDGKYYAAGSFTYRPKVKKARTFRDDSPILRQTPDAEKKLYDLKYLLQAKGPPVVGALWFFNQTAVQNERKVGYYDLLGLKSQDDFLKLVRFNKDTAKDLEHKKLIKASQISVKRVRLVRLDRTTTGGLWSTFDSALPVDRANPFRNLDDDLQFDATEKIGRLPNGMWAYLLANNKGVLQGNAPDNIVGGHKFRPNNKTQLEINYSCISCHFAMVKHEAGLKDLNHAVPPRRLDSPDYDLFLKLQRQYLRPEEFAFDLKVDRERTTLAIFKATGMEPQEYGQQTTRWFDEYEEGDFDLSYLSRDLGIPEASLRKACLLAEKVPGALDANLSLMLSSTVPKDLYEEAIYLAWDTWRKYGP